MKTFRHYGSTHFNERVFKEAYGSTCNGLKPLGGLWGSDEEGYGWSRWIVDSKYKDGIMKAECGYFDFVLSDKARLLSVTKNELDKYILLRNKTILHDILPDCPETIPEIDWEEIKKDYDAVYIPAGSKPELNQRYYGFDCDSIIVLNKDMVREIA